MRTWRRRARPSETTSRCCAATPNGSPAAPSGGSCSGSGRHRSRSRATGKSSRSCSAATSWSTTTDASSRRTPVSATRCQRSWWCAPSAIAACRTPGLPFDEQDRHHPAHRRPDRRQPQRIRGRLDQAWAHRRDRQQQEGLAGDRRHADRGPGRRLAARISGPTTPRSWWSGCWSGSRKLVTDDHWKLIDEYERSTGEPHGRPRVKLTSVAELLRIAPRLSDTPSALAEAALALRAGRRPSCPGSSAST